MQKHNFLHEIMNSHIMLVFIYWKILNSTDAMF